jgi:hypothetical protein
MFDQFVKHGLKIRHYARYTDDFVIVSHDRTYLENLIQPIQDFLQINLHLNLHPKKIEIRKYSHGIDFLGYVILPYCRLIRKRTWKRMLRRFRGKVKDLKQDKISQDNLEQSLQSYLGVLSHADAEDLEIKLRNELIF